MRAAPRLATVALLVLLSAIAAGPVSIGPVDAAPSDDNPVSVLVTTLAPRSLGAGLSPVQVAGTLTNHGSSAIRSVLVRLRVGEAITNRSQLAAADNEPSATTRRGPVIAVNDLGPGQTAAFDLQMTVADLHLRGIGVYPIQVEARGQVGNERSSTQIGLASSYVPWFPSRPVKTRIAWLWPVVDSPHQGQPTALINDGLATSLAAGGRLTRLLDGVRTGALGACDVNAVPFTSPTPAPASPGSATAGPAAAGPATIGSATVQPVPVAPCQREVVPVTYAVDADLLNDVLTVTKPYRVTTGDGRTLNQPGLASARRWLAGLRSDVISARNDVFALPWADPDLVAINRQVALRDEVAKAQSLGQRTTQDLLQTTLLTGVAWPPPGPLTPAALDAVVAGDTSAVVLDETALPPLPDQTGRTPDTRAQISSSLGGVTGLVVDSMLSDLVAAPAGAQGARLAEQRWLVETAMIAAERPGEARTLVVAPSRRAMLDPTVVANVVADSGRLPWLCPVALRDVPGGRETCTGQAQPAVGRPAEDRGQFEPPQNTGNELPPTYLQRVIAARATEAQLTDAVLTQGNTQTTDTKARLLKARLRTESVAWRSDPQGGQRMLQSYLDEVNGLCSMVTVTTGGRVLLTSTSGTIKVSIQNRLNQPVTVGVDLSAANLSRLTTQPTTTVEVGPSSSRTVDIKVTALTSGRFLAYAQLRDRDGRPFGARTELVVRSSRYGRVALALTGLGAGLLLVAVGVRITRRALRRDPAGPAAPGPAG